MLITGDLLVNPISFALSCYPSGWLQTLERMDALDTAVIVPGHGEPLHDKTLLRANIGVMRELLREGADAKRRGLDPDQAKAEVMPRLHDAMVSMTGDDPARNDRLQGLSRRLVSPPRLRRAQRTIDGRDFADSAEVARLPAPAQSHPL